MACQECCSQDLIGLVGGRRTGKIWRSCRGHRENLEELQGTFWRNFEEKFGGILGMVFGKL